MWACSLNKQWAKSYLLNKSNGRKCPLETFNLFSSTSAFGLRFAMKLIWEEFKGKLRQICRKFKKLIYGKLLKWKKYFEIESGMNGQNPSVPDFELKYKSCPNECDRCHFTDQWCNPSQFFQRTHLLWFKSHPTSARSSLYVKCKLRYEQFCKQKFINPDRKCDTHEEHILFILSSFVKILCTDIRDMYS